MVYLLGGYMWLFTHRPFEIWPMLEGLHIERVYIIFCMFVWVVAPNKTLVPNRIHAAQACFCCVLVFSWLMSPWAYAAGCYEGVENYAKIALFYVLMVTTIRDEKSLRQLIFFFMTSVGLYMSHSVVEFFNGRRQWRMGISRMCGVDASFGDPNAFAATVVCTLPYLLPFWLERPRRVPRIVIIGYALLALFCVIKTGSRAGFLATGGLGVLVVLSVARSVGHAVKLFLCLGILALMTLPMLPEELQNRFLSIIDSSVAPKNAAESAEGRLEGLILGIHLWQQSPLYGIGPMAFVHSNPKGLQAHNLYGQVLSELGLMGVCALLGVVTCLALNWWESRQLAKQDPTRPMEGDFVYQLSHVLGISLLQLLVLGCAGHNLLRYHWQWFAAFSAIALYCLRQRALARSHETVWPADMGYTYAA